MLITVSNVNKIRFVFLGEWRVTLYCQGKRIDSCQVDVCDPSRVKVIDLKGGIVGRPNRFKGRRFCVGGIERTWGEIKTAKRTDR